VDSILADLRSGEANRQASAIEALLTRDRNGIALDEATADELILLIKKNTPLRFAFADKLCLLAHRLIGKLKDLHKSTSDWEVRVLTGILLVCHGELDNCSVLLDEVQNGGEYRLIAVRHLVDKSVPGTIRAIQGRLDQLDAPKWRRTSSPVQDEIELLVEQLIRAGGQLPPAMAKRLSEAGYPKTR
jgi:hypothetical protein